jgi:hypothetical protein
MCDSWGDERLRVLSRYVASGSHRPERAAQVSQRLRGAIVMMLLS